MPTRTIVTRTRRAEKPESTEFNFTREMLPGIPGNGATPGFIEEYRLRAWEAFERLPLPSTSEEAWRRTDLHGMPAGSFQLPVIGAYEDLPPAPASY